VNNNVNGLLCRPKDANDLAEKMVTMASSDNEILENFGLNGRSKMVREYNENVVIDKYLQTLQSLQKAS